MNANDIGRQVDRLLRDAIQADRDAHGLARAGQDYAAARMADEAAKLRAEADRVAATFAAEVRP